MRYLPSLEKLREKGGRCLANDKELGLGIQFCKGGGEVGLTVESNAMRCASAIAQTLNGFHHCNLTGTAIYSVPLSLDRHSEDPSTRWDKDILVGDPGLL